MFLPNTRADLYRRSTESNNFGKHEYSTRKSVPCSVIYLNVASKKSSVRADTSGSRGQADQMEGDARFCFPLYVALQIGDAVFKDDTWLEIIEIEPRRNVLGQLDHNQVEFAKIEPIR